MTKVGINTTQKLPPPEERGDARGRSRKGSSKFNTALADVLEQIGNRKHKEPFCIAEGMSYGHATSTTNAIRKGKFGEGWLATHLLEHGVEPLENAGLRADFKHYCIWVAYDAQYTGDRTMFP